MSKIQIPPRFGPWQDTEHVQPEYRLQYVLGFYDERVICVVRFDHGGWFQRGTGLAVDGPVCWAEIIYPQEDE